MRALRTAKPTGVTGVTVSGTPWREVRRACADCGRGITTKLYLYSCCPGVHAPSWCGGAYYCGRCVGRRYKGVPNTVACASCHASTPNRTGRPMYCAACQAAWACSVCGRRRPRSRSWPYCEACDRARYRRRRAAALLRLRAES